jgi:hypothetical protein
MVLDCKEIGQVLVDRDSSRSCDRRTETGILGLAKGQG